LLRQSSPGVVGVSALSVSCVEHESTRQPLLACLF
jgi:hypothetical protein